MHDAVQALFYSRSAGDFLFGNTSGNAALMPDLRTEFGDGMRARQGKPGSPHHPQRPETRDQSVETEQAQADGLHFRLPLSVK